MSGMLKHKITDSSEYPENFEILLTNQLQYISEKYLSLALILLTVRKTVIKRAYHC